MEYLASKFYVGEIKINYHFDTIGRLNDIEKVKFEKHNTLIKNGAINALNMYVNEFGSKCFENNILSVFLHLHDKIYLCLHDLETYSSYFEMPCVNMERLNNFLPEIDYDEHSKMSVRDALKLFDALFKNNHKLKYNNTQFDREDFFTGTIDLCTGYENKYKNEKVFFSPILKYLLMANKNNGLLYQEKMNGINYQYIKFNTVFLQKNSSFYSINTNRFYQFSKDNEIIVPTNPVIEVHDTLDNVLNRYNINGSNNPTIPKVLKLQRKINERCQDDIL